MKKRTVKWVFLIKIKEKERSLEKKWDLTLTVPPENNFSL
jgi:hypothetical protein